MKIVPKVEVVEEKKIEVVEQKPTELQLWVDSEIKKTVNGVAMEVLLSFHVGKALTPDAFIAKYITPKQDAVKKLEESKDEKDIRINKFFKLTMGEIDQELNKNPALVKGFQVYSFVVGDNQLRDKMVKGIALPFVQDLITTFDKKKTSIVDDIIAG